MTALRRAASAWWPPLLLAVAVVGFWELWVIVRDSPAYVLPSPGRVATAFGESADRTRRLADYLAGQGLGAHRERVDLENWQCGQDRVALVMHNDLYPDAVIGQWSPGRPWRSARERAYYRAR